MVPAHIKQQDMQKIVYTVDIFIPPPPIIFQIGILYWVVVEITKR